MGATIGAGETVCMTGASGYIALWLVKLLLQRGYTIEASIDPNKTEHLLALNGAKERLQLFEADLLEEDSFDPVIEGCVGVFHTASPFYLDVKDPLGFGSRNHTLVLADIFLAELLDPAVKGTLNVLKSSSKTPSVQRVVFTSPMAAVAYNGRLLTTHVVMDESWFSDPYLCRQTKMWYALSKTLAEDAARKFAEEKGIDMVTINPAMVIGPLLQPTLNTSSATIANQINDAPAFPNATMGWVDVKDVANAHTLAFEVPSAGGRYCLVERVAHYSEIGKSLCELYPSLQLPEKCVDDRPSVPISPVSKEKARSLGLDYVSLDQSLQETVESLTEKGFVKF